MNLLESIGCKNIESRAFLWWESKSKDEKLELESHCAIIAPSIGTMLGTLLVFIAL